MSTYISIVTVTRHVYFFSISIHIICYKYWYFPNDPKQRNVLHHRRRRRRNHRNHQHQHFSIVVVGKSVSDVWHTNITIVEKRSKSEHGDWIVRSYVFHNPHVMCELEWWYFNPTFLHHLLISPLHSRKKVVHLIKKRKEILKSDTFITYIY